VGSLLAFYHPFLHILINGNRATDVKKVITLLSSVLQKLLQPHPQFGVIKSRGKLIESEVWCAAAFAWLGHLLA
jgi:hypothetical protein